MVAPHLCASCGFLIYLPPSKKARAKPRLTCSRSCAVRLSWKNPESAAKRRAGISASKQTPEAVAALAAHNERRWSRPEEHQKLSEQNRREWKKPRKRARRIASIKAVHGTPEKRAFYSRMRTDQWAHDRLYRQKTVAGIRSSKGTPEARAMFFVLLRDRWNDPEMRAKYTAANAARNNPEHRERNRTRMLAHWREDADFRALVSATMELYWTQPGVREAQASRMKVLWADPIWRMRQLGAMNRKGQQAGNITEHLNLAADLMSAVDAVVPKGLPEFMRSDITQDIVLALLEGDIKLNDLKSAAKSYLTEHRKMFPDKYGPLSLDAPIPGTDGLTIMDRLSNESAHF